MRDDVCLPVLVCHQSWLSTQVHQPKIWPWEEWLLYFSSLFFQTSSDLFFIHSLLVWHLKNCTRRWHCHTYEFWRKIPNSRQIAMSPHHDRHKSQGGLFSQGLHQQLTSRAIPAPHHTPESESSTHRLTSFDRRVVRRNPAAAAPVAARLPPHRKTLDLGCARLRGQRMRSVT